MRRRELIFQTKKSIKKFTGIDASIIMGNEKGFDPECNIQVCSIDTISRRIGKNKYKFLLDFDYVIVDECHDSTSPKYLNFLNMFPDKYWIGFTATPFNTGNKYLEEWEDIICPIEPEELRDQGYLVPEKTYAPKKIDLTGISTTRGDYDNKTLAERASGSAIVGDIIQTWIDYGDNRPTILFAVNKEHSKIMAEAFRQAGISAIHQDESHNSQERQDAIKKLENGTYKILCNVNIFSTGVDIPRAGCGIFARPTKSEILYVQQVGRILRTFKICGKCRADCGAEPVCFRCGSDQFTDIKESAILLDHANNCERFGLAFKKRNARIVKPDKKETKKAEEDLIKTCSKCYLNYEGHLSECPDCGHENEKVKRKINEIDGELELKSQESMKHKRILKIKNDLLKFSYSKWKPVVKWIKLHEIYGDEIYDYKEELEMPRWARSQVTKIRKQQTKEALQRFIRK
jgi:superfamily II DNA or RNA helicase